MVSPPPACSRWASVSRAFSARSDTTRGGRCPSWRGACDVGRYRPSPLMRWLHALGVVVAYVVVAAGLLWLDVGDFGAAPPWTVIAAPVFYALPSLVLPPPAALQRRLRWFRRARLAH